VSYCEEKKIEEIVKKYSEYVTYPVMMNAAGGSARRLNTTTPVWVRNKKDNTPQDYGNLYKQISGDWREPLVWEHIHAEGTTEFKSVLFVPEEALFDLYTREANGLQLYVKRILILEKCKELIPEYLRFVCGVVETDELPLNVSREMLQHNAQIPLIKKQIVKKILSCLQNLANTQPEVYSTFYSSFGTVLKEGFHTDLDNQGALAELVRFKSSVGDKGEQVSLKQYWERRASGQTEIYYLTGTSFEAVARSPHLEALTSRGIEVLFLTDPVDEWMVASYTKYNNEHFFKSVAKGDLDLRGVGVEPQTADSECLPEVLAPLLETFRQRLKAEIKDVRVSKRLTESPCCLVSDENSLSSQMERLLKMTNQSYTGSKKILEVNPHHPLIKSLAELSHSKLEEWVDILYETALVSEGGQPKNPGEYAKRLTKILERAAVTDAL
jgi:molecular chaperone HtpG